MSGGCGGAGQSGAGLDKLLLLLGHGAPGSRLLLVGQLPAPLLQTRSGNHDVRHVPHPDGAAATEGGYGLIVWRHDAADFGDAAAKLAQLLSAEGVLVAFCVHRLSLLRGRRSLRALLDRRRLSARGYTRALERAGLRVAEAWLPWPSIDDPEEYLSRDDVSEVSRSAGTRPGTAARLRSMVHDGYVYVARRAASRRGPDTGEAIAREVARALGRSILPRVSRFDLRDRGALVVMLRDDLDEVVVRLSASAVINTYLAANDANVRRLRADAAGCTGLVDRLPVPLGTGSSGSTSMWIERRLHGTVAWRLPLRLRRLLDRDLVAFLLQMARLGTPPRPLEAGEADSLVRRWRVPESGLPVALGLEVDALQQWLARCVSGHALALGWSHGDFGYGNVLADSASGRLLAVIDWETAYPDEPVGMDWMNWLLASERMHNDDSLCGAVDRVDSRLAAASPADYPVARLLELLHGHPGSAAISTLTGLALLRVVQREARYPAIHAARAEDHAAALRLFLQRVRG